MKKNRVVITGMGVLAPNGNGIDAFSNSLEAGTSGLGKITNIDPVGIKSNVAGEIKGFDPIQYMPIATARKTDRFAQLGIAVAGMAIADSQLDGNELKNAAVIIGSGVGGANFHEETIYKFILTMDPKQIPASSVPRITPNAVSAQIALRYGIHGKNYVISTACSSGSNAIGEAFLSIRNGDYKVALAGGVEATISLVNILMYQAMMVLGAPFDNNDDVRTASRPFDATRNGFVMAEGAACLVLESLDSAIKRGAHIHAEIIGFGSGCGCHHMVAPNPTGEDAQAIMELAIKDAAIKADEVDVVYAHGTSTKYNDVAETRAIKAVFGDRACKIPVSAIKSMIGHTIGAAAAIQAVAMCICLEKGTVAPTINLKNTDIDCDLDYVAGSSRKGLFKVGVSNAFGFGSNNSVLVFRRYEHGKDI